MINNFRIIYQTFFQTAQLLIGCFFLIRVIIERKAYILALIHWFFLMKPEKKAPCNISYPEIPRRDFLPYLADAFKTNSFTGILMPG